MHPHTKKRTYLVDKTIDEMSHQIQHEKIITTRAATRGVATDGQLRRHFWPTNSM